jgi:hypothetical protein
VEEQQDAEKPGAHLHISETHIGSHTPLPTDEELHPGAQYGVSMGNRVGQASARHASRFMTDAHSAPVASELEIFVT